MLPRVLSPLHLGLVPRVNAKQLVNQFASVPVAKGLDGVVCAATKTFEVFVARPRAVSRALPSARVVGCFLCYGIPSGRQTSGQPFSIVGAAERRRRCYAPTTFQRYSFALPSQHGTRVPRVRTRCASDTESPFLGHRSMVMTADALRCANIALRVFGLAIFVPVRSSDSVDRRNRIRMRRLHACVDRAMMYRIVRRRISPEVARRPPTATTTQQLRVRSGACIISLDEIVRKHFPGRARARLLADGPHSAVGTTHRARDRIV
jgi:hypothetical protein